MKIKKNRIFILLFSFFLTFCMSLSLVGCGFIKYDTYKSDYFIYQVSRENGEVYIVGLTDLGKQQKYLIIPEFLDNKKVNWLSEVVFDIYQTKREYGNLEGINYYSENLKKIFIISDIKIINAWLSSGIFSKKEVFYISNGEIESLNNFYRTSLQGNTESYSITAANVSYYYNYENSPNDGYYWIDNYGYGELIEYIPKAPIREGYLFGGWYKENECINAWNFEIDKLPQAQYNEYQQEIYQETRLYAKWIQE